MAYWEIVSDVWTDILCLLPVKTLLVMRAVNKYFLSLINSSELCNSFHRSRHPPKRDASVLVVSLDMDYTFSHHSLKYYPSAPSYCRIGQMNNFNGHLDTIKYSTNLISSFSPSSVVVASLHGLVLLTARHGKEDEVATLWNPSIRKYRSLPPPSQYSQPNFSSLKLALGYDNSTKDFKVLAMVNHIHRSEADDNLQSWGVWVYSVVKTRSWAPVFNSGLTTMNSVFNFWMMSEPVAFKGSVFWIENAWNNKSYSQRLTRFDLATNRFLYSRMPDYDASFGSKRPGWYDQRLTNIKDTYLAVDNLDIDISVWIMRDVDAMTWTRVYFYSQDEAYEMNFKFWIKSCCLFYGGGSTRRVDTAGVYLESLLLLT